MSFFNNSRASMFIVSLALFMESLDAYAINTAIPSMAKSLMVNPVDLKIALIGYLLSLAIFIPISGWMADKYGAKNVFMYAVSIFLISSIACGFSYSLTYLVIARVLQGLGGAMMLPVARLLLLRAVGKTQLLNAMSRVIMFSSLGLMLGPVLGGFITHYLSWRWIFWINIPFGIATLLIAYFVLTENTKHDLPPLDKIGFVLFGLGLAGFTLALASFSESTIPIDYCIIILISSFLLIMVYLWRSRYQPHPIVKTALFRERIFRVSILGSLFARLGFSGMPFLIPLLLQIGLGYSALKAGILLIPMAAGVALVKKPSTIFLRKIGYRNLLIINTLLVGLSLWTFSLVDTSTAPSLLIFLIFIFGFLISLQYGAMNTLNYSCVRPEDYSSATSFISIFQQLANSFGVAVSAFFLRYFSPHFGIHSTLTIAIIHHAIFAMALLTVLSAFIFTRLLSEDGKEMITIKTQS